MPKKQNIVGKKTEKDVCKIFREHGYWVYNIPSKTYGQPFDIVAAKETTIWLTDGKHVRGENVSFDISRIEPNQWASMQYAIDYAKLKNVGFVIDFERTNTLYYLPFTKCQELKKQNIKSINLKYLDTFEDKI